MDNVKRQWHNLLDGAFYDMRKQFFVGNYSKYWSDLELITAVTIAKAKGKAQNELKKLNSNKENSWIYQFIHGFGLRDTTYKAYLKSNIDYEFEQTHCITIYSEFFPSIDSISNPRKLQDFISREGKTEITTQTSSWSKLTTLSKPLKFWITDSKARGGLGLFLNKEYVKHDYIAFFEDVDSIWQANSIYLISYVKNGLSNLEQDTLAKWNNPIAQKDDKIEVLARRFLDKILMLRYNQNQAFTECNLLTSKKMPLQ